MNNKVLAGILMAAVGTTGAVLFAAAFIAYIRFKMKCDKLVANTKGWLKGYMAGNKEFADYVRDNDPELYAKIESY